MTCPPPPVYHGDANTDGRYYEAFGDIFVNADKFFTITGHSLAQHFERYGWRAEDIRRRPAASLRQNLFVRAFFPNVEPNKGELRKVCGVATTLHALGRCASCAARLQGASRVVCASCVP